MFADLVDDMNALSDTDLHELIRTTELERRRLDTQLATAITIADQRQLNTIDGHTTITAYLRANLNWSTTEATRFRSLGRAVKNVDGLGDAWLSGRFGLPQATQFARALANPRIRDALPAFTPILLDQAEHLPYPDFAECVRHVVVTADTQGAHDDRDHIIEHRDAHVTEVAGSLNITAHGGNPLTTAEVVSIFERFEHAEFDADLTERRRLYGDQAESFDLARTPKQRRHDALIAIFRAAATTNDVGSTTDPLVNIVIDADTWARLLVGAGLAPDTDLDGNPIHPFTGSTDPADLLRDLTADPNTRCETTNGQQLHPHDVLRAALAGHIRRVVIDSNSVIIDQGRKQRCYTGSARDAAKLLIKRCEHPGCELPTAFCHVDHATEWTDDGLTDQTNSRIRCAGHNTKKHRHKWASTRANNHRTYTIRPDGTIMIPTGVRPPTFPHDGDDFDEAAETIHLTNLARQRINDLAG